MAKIEIPELILLEWTKELMKLSIEEARNRNDNRSEMLFALSLAAERLVTVLEKSGDENETGGEDKDARRQN